MPYCLLFNYGADGRGMLELHDGDTVAAFVRCRTGSIDTSGDLINAIEPGHWYVVEPSRETREPAMIWPGRGAGWKTRLWRWNGDTRTYLSTRYLIHPDGGAGGTMGCIGLLDDGEDMRSRIDVAVRAQVVPVYVGIPRSEV